MEIRNVEVTLKEVDSTGTPVVEIDDQKLPIFGAIKGERVHITAQISSNKTSEIQLSQVIEKSIHRVDAPCIHFGECTGCQWQHISYQHQLSMKYQIVINAFKGVRDFDVKNIMPTLPSPKQYGYRNHARFTVSKREGLLGFINKESRSHIAISECKIMDWRINEILASIQGKVNETAQLAVRVGQHTDSRMVQPRLLTSDVPINTGQEYYEERIKEQTFRIGSPSFFQVNTEQAEHVVDLVIQALHLKGDEVVIDAYAGVGIFAVMLAPHVKKVIGIEYSEKAVSDAAFNAQGLPQVEFKLGKSEVVLRQLTSQLDDVDAVILDPPRSGCEKEALKSLIDLAPRRIVYVSCEPVSLARDIDILLSGPFKIDKIQPVDMFPQTRHVECIVTLNRDQEKVDIRSNRGNLVLASKSPRRQDILSRLGIKFITNHPSVVEKPEENAKADDLAITRALEKARTVARGFTNGVVIGADTVVQLGDLVLGKPADRAEAFKMLNLLRDREHNVITAIALVDANTDEYIVDHLISRVRMRNYSEKEMIDFIETGHSFDKAGAYAVQDEFFYPAAEVSGCYLNVVGLPVCKLVELFEQFGVPPMINVQQGWKELIRCPACSRKITNMNMVQNKKEPGI